MAKPTFITEATPFLTTWLNHLFPTLQQPSISIAIVHKNEVVFRKAWGFANTEKKEVATPDHIYRIASHSKTFTSFLVGILIEEGVLKLDEPLLTYLPWLKPNKAYANLTLRHVLSHSTGNERDGEDSSHWSYTKPFPSQAEMKAYFLSTKPIVESDTRFKYSNHAYALAGMAIETATGESYDTLITRKILNPLKLKSTGSDNPRKGTKLCTGYTSPMAPDGKQYALNPILSAEALACVTGFHSTPSELALAFSAFILETKLVSRSMQKQIMRPTWASNPDKTDQSWYCLGLSKITRNGKYYYGHSGGYPGFITRTMVLPELETTVCICTNSLNADNLSIGNTIFDALLHFKNERGSRNALSKYESPFYGLWGSSYTLAGNGKLISLDLTSKAPFTDAAILKPQKTKDTFLITNVDGYNSPNELAVYTMKNNKPVSRKYGAFASIANYQEHLDNLKKISKF